MGKFDKVVDGYCRSNGVVFDNTFREFLFALTELRFGVVGSGQSRDYYADGGNDFGELMFDGDDEDEEREKVEGADDVVQQQL